MSNPYYSGVDIHVLAATVASQVARGSTASLIKLSSIPLSAGAVVRVMDMGTHVERANVLNGLHAVSPLAITTHAVAAADMPIECATFGELTIDGWSFAPNAGVYLGPNGTLTQTRDPAWAYFRLLGIATSATRLFLSPQLPIYTA